MGDKIQEHGEYFSTHCHLPAGMIADLFDEIERLQSRIKVLEAMVERLEGEVKHHQGTALAAVEDKDDEKIDPWHCRVCGERTGIGNGYCAMHGALAAVEDKT